MKKIFILILLFIFCKFCSAEPVKDSMEQARAYLATEFIRNYLEYYNGLKNIPDSDKINYQKFRGILSKNSLNVPIKMHDLDSILMTNGYHTLLRFTSAVAKKDFNSLSRKNIPDSLMDFFLSIDSKIVLENKDKKEYFYNVLRPYFDLNTEMPQLSADTANFIKWFVTSDTFYSFLSSKEFGQFLASSKFDSLKKYYRTGIYKLVRNKPVSFFVLSFFAGILLCFIFMWFFQKIKKIYGPSSHHGDAHAGEKGNKEPEKFYMPYPDFYTTNKGNKEKKIVYFDDMKKTNSFENGESVFEFEYIDEKKKAATFEIFRDNDVVVKLINEHRNWLERTVKNYSVSNEKNIINFNVNNKGRVEIRNEKWHIKDRLDATFETDSIFQSPRKITVFTAGSVYYLPFTANGYWVDSDKTENKKNWSIFKLELTADNQGDFSFLNEDEIRNHVINKSLKSVEHLCFWINTVPTNYNGYEIKRKGRVKLADGKWNIEIAIKIEFRESVKIMPNTSEEPGETIAKPDLPKFYLGLPDDQFFSPYGQSPIHKPGLTLFEFTPISDREAKFVLISDESTVQWMKAAYTDKIKPACNLNNTPSMATTSISTDSCGEVKWDEGNKIWKITRKAKVTFI